MRINPTIKEYSVKDKIDRAKQFVQRHQVACAYGAGAVVGIAATTYATLKYPVMPKELEVFVSETPEQLFKPMAERNINCLRLNSGNTAVYLYTGVNLELL